MKAKNVIKWLVVNGAMAALMWFGFGPERVDGARYVYTFFLSMAVLLLTITAFSADLKASLREKGRSVHGLVCFGYDLACTAFLVWNGHWVLGCLIMWQASCISAIFAEPKKVEEKAV